MKDEEEQLEAQTEGKKLDAPNSAEHGKIGNESSTTGANPVTSNSPVKDRVPSEELDIDPKRPKSPSTSGPKGTEEPGSDKGPGGTGW